MPHFEPFSGLRYTPSMTLNDVICPPYDIISPDQREIYANRSSANAIHVELPSEDGNYSNRYEHAASVWREWIDSGTVLHDPATSLYVYRMTPSNGRSTTGIVGALRLEEPGDSILPHEETISKDKTDRLELLRHCKANISPIWGLSLASGLASLYGDLLSDVPTAVAVDSDGVVHELWVISDAAVVDRICEVMGSSPIVIADGHHRFETALAYAGEAADPGSLGVGEGSGLVMAFIVELSDEQMTVMPIHRLVKLSPSGSIPQADIIDAFKTFFEVLPLESGDSGAAENEPDDNGSKDNKPDDSGSLTWPSRPSSEGRMEGRMVLVLHGQIFELIRRDRDNEMVVDSSIVRQALSALDIPDGNVSYTSEPDAAVESVSTGKADFAILMRSVTVSQIAAYAREKKRMPPKSTYFWPKPRTGMVFRSLY
ncbi:MAG: DUF1015 domain-containing protein [Actinobacteria bacterium]|nr:DUF1015 domain-containing protein [Actinomycetota bacterium]